METKKIAILGCGLTGLTLGYLLRKKNVNFEILEKENECGGLMRSLNVEGFTFDYGGSHVIFSKDKPVLKFMLRLLGSNKIKNKRNTKILYKNHYVKYPFENGLSDLPKEENYECLYYFIRNLINKEKGDLRKPNNLKDWCFHTFGKGIAEKYLIPYNKKIWKYPLNKISIDWVKRIPNPPVEDILKSSLGIKTEGYTHQLHFYYPRFGGINAVINALETTVKDAVITNFDVKRLKKDNKQWIISNGKEARTYDKIICTLPIQKLVTAMDSSNEVKTAAGNLKYNSLITVMIGLNTRKVTNLSWLYIADVSVLPHRVSFPSNYSPNVAPTGKSSVLAEITCTVNSKIWKTSDVEIANAVIRGLHTLEIIDKTQVTCVKIKRMEYAYVINDSYYSSNMKTILNYTDMLGIDLVGRFAEFKYLNMDDCVRSAMNYVLKTKSLLAYV